MFLYGALAALFGVSSAFLAAERLTKLGRFFANVFDGAVPNWDFQVYYALGYLARTGRADQVYDAAAQVQWIGALTGDVPASSLGFAYPPYFVAIMSPLSWLAEPIAYRLFLGLNVVIIAAIAVLLWQLAAPAPRWLRAALVLLVVASDATYHVLAPGQISGVLVLAMAGGLLLLRRGHDLPAGAAFAVVALKPHLAIGIVLLLLLRGRHRALAGFGATLGSLVGLSAVFMGPLVYWDHASAILGHVAGGGVDAINYERMHSWRGVLATAGLDGTTAVYALAALAVAATVLGLALWAWRRGLAEGDGAGGPEWSVALMLPLLLTSHLWAQDLLILAVVAALMLSQVATAGQGMAGSLRGAAVVFAGYVALAETYTLAEQGVSLTFFVLLAGFAAICVAPRRIQHAEQAPRADPHAEALAA